MSGKKIFATPQDVESAFYEALERADLELMMSVWSEDEEVICVHPGGPRLVGYRMIYAAWQRIFEKGAQLQVSLSQQATVTTPFAVISTLIEQIQLRGQDAMTAPVATTNIFVRGAQGWRMVVHHGSPVPPDSINEAPKVLH
jgi:ketosteroid isomerase-like protein